MLLAWESLGVAGQLMLPWESLGFSRGNDVGMGVAAGRGSNDVGTGVVGGQVLDHVGNGPVVLCCHGSRCESVEGQMMLALKSLGVGVAAGRR